MILETGLRPGSERLFYPRRVDTVVTVSNSPMLSPLILAPPRLNPIAG